MSRSGRQAHRLVLATSLLLALGACKTSSSPAGLSPAPPLDPTPPAAGWPELPEILGGWFVQDFDQTAVQQVRSQERFTRQHLSYTLSPSGHPDGRLTFRGSNAFEDAGVDYAWSTGLSGKGALVSVVDSRIRENHEALAGVEISLAPGAAPHTDTHGTSVAGVIAGPYGVAPDAAIHHGAISFSDTQMLPKLAGIMRDAEAKGALFSNNSWAFIRGIDESMNGSFLDGQDGRRYVSSLRDFSRNGIVVFAAENDHAARSAHVMAALPVLHPDLEQSWLTAINAVPVRDDGRVVSAERISAPCLEAARWCLAANGQLRVATDGRANTAVGSGASFAAPQVSGALALLSEAFPGLAPEQLRARLLATADNGFFPHEGEVEFAPGLRHGYSSEWGHGFLDLRSALLPIGQAHMATAAGGRVAMDQAVMVSGRAMGDALSRGLSSVELVMSDQLDSDFTMSADGLVHEGRQSAAEMSPLAMRLSRGDAGRARAAALAAIGDGKDGARLEPLARTDEAGSPIGLTQEIGLLAGEDAEITTIIGEYGTGVRLTRGFDAGNAGFTLGLEALEERGSIMGMSGPRRGYGSNHVAVVAGASFGLGDAALLRIDGRLGRSEGGRLGELAEIGHLGFDSIGASISFAGPSRSDLLTFYARQPLAVTGGTASLTLARPAAAGGLDFTPADVALAPDARQLDIGLEYARPIGQWAELSAAARWSDHHGNKAGRTDGEIGLTLQARF